MNRMKKLFALLAALCLTVLAGCGTENTPEDTSVSGGTETVTETTTETVPGYEGEVGKPLTVDFETHGTVAQEAAALNSKTIVLNGVTLELPCLVSNLTDNGWSFYSETMSQKLVSAGTEASIMGFTMYLGDQGYLELGKVRNDAAQEAPVSACYVTKLTIHTLDHETEDGFDFVLPGGITGYSTAADVIEVFGPAQDNEVFDYVQTGPFLLYYAEHAETALSYAFSFNEDGTLQSVTISF